MVILQRNQYDCVAPFLVDIPGALYSLETTKNSDFGKVIVNQFPDAKTVYLETPHFFYFAGQYQQAFMEEIMSCIISECFSAGETRTLFIFSSNQEWKSGLEGYLRPYINEQFGAYVVRQLLHLDEGKYSQIRKSIVKPRDLDYVYETKIEEDGSMRISVQYCGEEIGHYSAGLPALGVMDFDVFTHEDHRHKGLSLFCCSKLIDYCLENDIMPQWGCWTVNVPSCKLAEKLGFMSSSETMVNLAEITHVPNEEVSPASKRRKK